MPSLIDFFSRPDTASGLGSEPGGRAWQIISGTWRIVNGQPISISAATNTSSPIAVIDLPESPDAFTAQAILGPGDALFFRVQDALNWWRLKHTSVQSTTSTVVTEAEWRCIYGGATLISGTSGGFVAGHTHSETLTWMRTDLVGDPCGVLIDHGHDTQAIHRHSRVSATKTGNTRSVGGGSFVSYTRTLSLELNVNGVIQTRGSWTNLVDFLFGSVVIYNRTSISVYADTTFLGTHDSEFLTTRTKHGIGYVPSSYTAHNLDSFTLKWSNSPPLRPTLLEPVNNATVDMSGALRFSWQFNDPGDTQSSWMFARLLDGASAYTYWNATTGAFQSEEVWNVGAAQSYLFPTGQWISPNRYSWKVATADSQGVAGSFSTPSVVVGGAAPTATIIAPTEIVTVTTRPVVQWTYFSQQARPQQSYTVKIFTEAQAVVDGFNPSTATPQWSSGSVLSATVFSHVIGFDAVSGTAYRAYVQVVDSLSIASSWAYAPFTVQLVGPSAPGLELIPEVNDARILLRVTATHSFTTFPTSFATIERLTPTGWVIVRGGAELTFGPQTAVAAYDWEATPNVATTYRARTTAIIATSFVASVEDYAQTIITPTAAWLKDPVDPIFNQVVSLRSVPTITREQERGVYEAIGRPDPVIVYGARRTSRGSFTIFCGNYAKRMAIDSLVANRRTLLLQIPSRRVGEPGEQWYLRPITATSVSPSTRVYGTPWDTTVDFAEVVAPPVKLFSGPFPPPPAQPALIEVGGDAVHTVSTSFTRSAVVTSITPVTDWIWAIEAGPASVGSIIGTTQSVTWTPAVVGTYTLRISATTEGIQSSDSMRVFVISGSVTGGSGLVTSTVGDRV